MSALVELTTVVYFIFIFAVGLMAEEYEKGSQNSGSQIR